MPKKEMKQTESSHIIVKVDDTRLGLPTSSEFNLKGVVDTNAAGFVIPNDEQLDTIDKYAGDVLTPVEDVWSDNIAAVAEIRYFDSLGGSQGQRRAQLAMKDQFIAIVGNNYYSIGVSEVDLMLLQQLNLGACEVICEIDRALYVYNQFDKINVAAGKVITNVLGFNWDDIARNKQSYIDVRNKLKNLINSKFYVAHTKAVDRSLYLCSRIFAEDVNRKTIYIAFTPEEYTSITNNSCNALGLFSSNEVGDTKYFTLDKLNSYVNDLEQFSLSAWYNEVAPYLFHLYGEDNPNLFKVADYNEENVLCLTYNAGLLEAIRNADYIGVPRQSSIRVSSAGSELTALRVFEDQQGYVCQGGAETADSACVAPLIDPILWKYGTNNKINALHKPYKGDRLVNVDDYPTDADVISSLAEFKVQLTTARFNNLESSAPVITTDNSQRMLEWSGSVCLMYVNATKVVDQDTYTDYVAKFFVITNVDSQLEYNALDGYTGAWIDIGNSDALFEGIHSMNRQFISQPSNMLLFVGDQGELDNLTRFSFKDVDNRYVLPERLLDNYWYASSYDSYKVSLPMITHRK